MKRLARGNGIDKSTGYDDLHEGIDVLVAGRRALDGALLTANAIEYSHINIDGILVKTYRVSTPGPTPEESTARPGAGYRGGLRGAASFRVCLTAVSFEGEEH